MKPKARKPITRWSLLDVRRIIAGRATLDGSFDDRALVTNRQPLSLLCNACGYRWITTKESLQKDRWCPKCAGREPWTYGRARAYAAERNGVVISDQPDSTAIGRAVSVRCSQGHAWSITKKCLDGKAWCPTCARANLGKQPRHRMYGRDVRALVGDRGLLLSTFADDDWVFDKHTVSLRCGSCSHEWSTSLTQLKRGQWCPACAGNKRWTVGRLKQLIDSRGGVLLMADKDDAVIHARKHVQVRCSCGNQWGITPSNLKNGHWCALCGGKSRWTVGRIRKIVEDRSGCLLVDLPDNQPITTYRFTFRIRCSFGHEWESTTSRLKKHWCPQCASGQGEEICRAFMEALFGAPFPKTRPPFLRYGSAGRCLELDGFCESLAVAFEHHGLQHYTEVSLFKDSHISLKERRKRDRFKRKRCRELGILLIEIPELNLLTSVANLRRVIIDQCKEAGRDLPFPNVVIESDRLVAISRLNVMFQRAQDHASANGGKCLSDHYITADAPMRWECSVGHKWRQSYASAVQGQRWCPMCGDAERRATVRQRLLDKCRRYAASRGGRVLSNECLGNRKPLLWQCAKGHQFKREPFSVLPTRTLKGSWCSQCHAQAKKKEMADALLARCRAHAKKLGGQVLASACTGAREPIRWRCRCGYAWDAQPAVVLPRPTGFLGTWCPKCRRIQATLSRLRTLRQKNARYLRGHDTPVARIK